MTHTVAVVYLQLQHPFPTLHGKNLLIKTTKMVGFLKFNLIILVLQYNQLNGIYRFIDRAYHRFTRHC